MRLGEHLVYSLLTLLLAAIIALPIGFAIGHTGRFRGLAVGVSGALRALPTLGLVVYLALITTNLTIVPPLIALTILAIPPHPRRRVLRARVGRPGADRRGPRDRHDRLAGLHQGRAPARRCRS